MNEVDLLIKSIFFSDDLPNTEAEKIFEILKTNLQYQKMLLVFLQLYNNMEAIMDEIKPIVVTDIAKIKSESMKYYDSLEEQMRINRNKRRQRMRLKRMRAAINNAIEDLPDLKVANK